MEGGINLRHLKEGFLPGDVMRKVQSAAEHLRTAPIYIDDTANITMLEIRSKSRRHTAQYDTKLIIVDYLQLMSGTRRAENRQVEIAEISRSIKGLARELRIPVMALSQLSREAEKDDTGIPKLSHLRESGAIEQDADVVMILWRPKAEENEDLIKLTVAKQRNGPTGHVDLLFLKNIQQFKSVAEREAKAAGRPAGVPRGRESYEGPEEDEETPF
jgi:replicative DNA helicase